MTRKDVVANMEHHMRMLKTLQDKVLAFAKIDELSNEQRTEHSRLYHQMFMILSAMQWDTWMISSEEVGGGFGHLTSDKYGNHLLDCMEEIDPNLDPEYANAQLQVENPFKQPIRHELSDEFDH